MSAFTLAAAFEMGTRDEWYDRMPHWVYIYFCLSLIVLFLKSACTAGFCVLLVGLWLGGFLGSSAVGFMVFSSRVMVLYWRVFVFVLSGFWFFTVGLLFCCRAFVFCIVSRGKR